MKKIIIGLLAISSLSAFADCSNLREAKKVCLQTILDNQENIDFNSVKLNVGLVSMRNQPKIAECFYTLNKTVELPDQTRSVRIVGISTYDAKTCKQLSGKAVSVDTL